MSRQLNRAAVAIATASLLVLASLGASAAPSNKWRISVNHTADSSGEIVFRVTPEGGLPVDVTTTVESGASENSIAKLMVAAFKGQVDGELFHVERDDWEDVLIKKRRGAADFELALVTSSVLGVTLDLDRE